MGYMWHPGLSLPASGLWSIISQLDVHLQHCYGHCRYVCSLDFGDPYVYLCL